MIWATANRNPVNLNPAWLSLFLLLIAGCLPAHTTDRSAAVGEDAPLSIHPGEQIYFAITMDNNTIVDARIVDAITDPESTLILKLIEMDDGKGMILSVENPLTVAIKYHINMVDYQGKLHATSSCPVGAGLSVYEAWPHFIPELRFTNIHVASEEEKTRCIY